MVSQGVNFNVHGIKKIAKKSCKVQFTDNNHSLIGELTYFVVSGELQVEQAKAKLCIIYFLCKLNEKMYGRKNKTSALLLIYDVGDLVL